MAMRLPPLAVLGDRRIEEPEVHLRDEMSVPPCESSLAFLQAIYQDPRQETARRMRAAIAALPFEHLKLAVIANIPGGSLSAQLEAAIARSGKSVVIDAKPLAISPPREAD